MPISSYPEDGIRSCLCSSETILCPSRPSDAGDYRSFMFNERVPVLRTGGDLDGSTETDIVPAQKGGSKPWTTANKSTKLIRQILARGPVPSAETRAPNGLHEETR